MKTVHHGSDAERADFLQNQGILIALFVDGLIQSLSLPKNGGVTVAGWSLGNVFTIAMRASIDDLPDNIKQRLKAYTRGFIVFGLSVPLLFQLLTAIMIKHVSILPVSFRSTQSRSWLSYAIIWRVPPSEGYT